MATAAGVAAGVFAWALAAATGLAALIAVASIGFTPQFHRRISGVVLIGLGARLAATSAR